MQRYLLSAFPQQDFQFSVPLKKGGKTELKLVSNFIIGNITKL
jgi:hypothetical protein